MKNFCKLFWIIVVVTIIGFSTMACDDDSGNGGNNDNGTSINVGQLPEFPSDSTPAGTRTDAEAILAELRQSPVLDSIQDEMWAVVEANSPDGGNYSFSNRSLPNGFVKVSASATSNETYTGGFQPLLANRKAVNDLYNAIYELDDNYDEKEAEIERLQDEIDRLEEERANIQFASGNKSNGTWNSNQKGELIMAKTEDGVTIAQGSTYETKINSSYNTTVTTAGTYTTCRINSTSSEKYQTIEAFTVATSKGSVKIIFDMTGEWSETENNVKCYWDEDDNVGTYTNIEKYSGSLKVYGSNNTLLIDHRIVDRESYETAQYMIIYNPNYLNFANATPLTENVAANGNVSQDSDAWYSINVTSGTTCHLWLNYTDTDNIIEDYINFDVGVEWFYSNGILFYDIDGDWSCDPDSGLLTIHYSFTATSTETMYIMVNSYNYSGTFKLVYNTTGTQPDMSVSFIAPFNANSRSMQNKINSVVIPKKPVGVLRRSR